MGLSTTLFVHKKGGALPRADKKEVTLDCS